MTPSKYQTPSPGGKKKKKLSKSERKKRKRERERQEQEGNKIPKEKNETPSTPATSTSSPPIQKEETPTSGMKLINETSFTMRKVSFVFPKKDKTLSNGDLAPYVHSKLSKKKKNIDDVGNIVVDDDERKEQEKKEQLKNDSIDDILFPERKKQKKSELELNGSDVQPITSETNKGDKTDKKKDATVEKSLDKKNNNAAKKDNPKKAEKKQKSKMMQEEKKEIEQDTPTPTHRGRSRSDSLSDPLKTKMAGRTVEDVINDKSGRRPRANSTDGELKLPKRGLCDERVVMQNYDWDLDTFVQGPPRGFNNLGNTCFLNSTMQCLAYLPTFCQCVAELPVNGGKKQKKPNHGLQMTMYVRNLLRRVHGLDGEMKQAPLSPKNIVRNISLLGGGSHRGYKFRPGRQEDAHEFLVHLLDSMNNGELKAAGIDPNKSGWRDRLPIPRLDETTLTHRMFGGYLRSQVKCTKCKYKSNTYDPFLDLSLEVSGKKVHSLYDALEEYTRKETLDADNKWKCDGCKKRVCATKQLTIFRPPLTLCIQLKRFSFGGGFGGFMHHQGFSHFSGKGMGMMRGESKVQKQIQFPSTLKLPLSDGRKCEYQLTGVVIHIGGSATSGHYTAFIRRVSKHGQAQWFNMDDSFVESVSEKTVLKNKNAYVLFYSRKEVQLELPTPPPATTKPISQPKDTTNTASVQARKESAEPSDTKNRLKQALVDMKKKEREESIKIQKAVSGKESPVEKISKKATTNKKESQESSDDSYTDLKSSSQSPVQVTIAKTESINSQEESSDDSDYSSPSQSSEESEDISLEDDLMEEENLQSGENEQNVGSASQSSSSSSSSSSEDDGEEEDSSISQGLKKVDSPPAKKQKVSESTSSASKAKKDLVLDQGSRGRVRVMLRKLKDKKKKAWKPQVSNKLVKDDKAVGLLGNKVVSGWDDDSDTDANVHNNYEKKKSPNKDAKFRKAMFEKNKKDEKESKRKMYLDSWDSALDAGRVKKVKDKANKPVLKDQSQAFQRIQQSMMHMNRAGPKGNKTSLKKRKR